VSDNRYHKSEIVKTAIAKYDSRHINLTVYHEENVFLINVHLFIIIKIHGHKACRPYRLRCPMHFASYFPTYKFLSCAFKLKLNSTKI